MKKILIFCLLIVSFVLTNSPLQKVNAEEELDLNATSAVLMEPKSKKIIYEKNKDQKLYPASMTKMMGLSLTLEAINNNKITWDELVTVSEYASSMGGTQIYLEVGEKMAVKDLVKAVAINSANDAICALLEHIYHSPSAFVKAMNDKAKELKMVNTNFKNATGFDDKEHYTTAYDMALLASYLVSFGNEILQFTSLKEAYIRENSDNPFWLVNTNKLLSYYDGMDGLKTGYTKEAMYNLTATASRKGVRLISVVMHEETIEKRSQDTIRLLDYGFSKYQCVRIFEKDAVIKELDIKTYNDIKINLIVKDNVDIILLKEEDKNDLKYEIELYEVEPPISKDEIIGKLRITTPSNMIYEYNLYSSSEVKKPDFLSLLIENMLSFFFA